MINNTYLFYVIPIIVLILGNLTPQNYSEKGQHFKTKQCHVLRVLDGDTITAECESKVYKVRLQFIDAPESHQMGPNYFYPIGKWSTQTLKSRLKKNLPIKLYWSEKDTYGRLIAVVYDDHGDVNLWMLAKGMATIYQFARFNNRSLRMKYYFTLLKASANLVGIWNLEFWQNPYYYRKSKKLKNEQRHKLKLD